MFTWVHQLLLVDHHCETQCNTLQHTATHCNTLQHTKLMPTCRREPAGSLLINCHCETGADAIALGNVAHLFTFPTRVPPIGWPRAKAIIAFSTYGTRCLVKYLKSQLYMQYVLSIMCISALACHNRSWPVPPMALTTWSISGKTDRLSFWMDDFVRELAAGNIFMCIDIYTCIRKYINILL